MSDTELLTGRRDVIGAVGRAAVGQDAANLDAVGLVEGDGLVEGVEEARDFFFWEEAGEGEAGVIIEGDVETFDPGVGTAARALAGGRGRRDAAKARRERLWEVK